MIKTYLFTLLASLLLSACGQPTQSAAAPGGAVTQVVSNCDPARLLLERDGDNYERFVVSDIPTVPSITLPTQDQLNGFGMGRVGKTDRGFYLGIEHGSRYYVSRTFYFECRGGEYFYTSQATSTFDKQNPEGEGAFDSTAVDPLALKDFDLMKLIEK